MINLNDYFKFNGKNVRVVDVDGKVFVGTMTVSTDFDTDKSYVDIEQQGKNYIVELQEDDIKSIELVK